jgi:Arc/MetJ-type ribon-helix-helix transcriptional regulator
MIVMSRPVTTRLDPAVVDALDRAVEAGLGATRAAVIAHAVDEWLQRHGENEIEASYRRRYTEPDPEHDETIASLAAFSVAACLAVNER